MKTSFLSAIICLLIVSCSSKSEVFVTSVHDGDTFYSKGESFRILDVDCPELDQPFGQEAKYFTEKFLLHKRISITRKGKDKYGRTLAEIRLESNGRLFSRILTIEGLAWVSDRYCHNSTLKEDMSNAKRNKRGLWKYPNIPPYQFRKLHRK